MVDLEVSALIMSIAAGMPGAIAVRRCGVQRAAVYERRRQEGTVRCKSALRKRHMRRSVDGCGSDAGRCLGRHKS